MTAVHRYASARHVMHLCTAQDPRQTSSLLVTWMLSHQAERSRQEVDLMKAGLFSLQQDSGEVNITSCVPLKAS